jgi:RHS repeat-associated protein
VNESYWANGATNQLSGLSGLPTITYGVDGEGRIYSASASSGQNPLSSTNYSVASLPTGVDLGSSDSDSFTYDHDTNRMTKYSLTVNGQSVVGNLTWNALGTLASLAVTDPFKLSDAQTCSYTHDDLSRIASANCGSIWSQTFSYDAFGNINKSGSSSFGATYSSSTNRMTMIGSSTPSYDSDGNVTNDFLNTYAWDSNDRPVTADSVGLTYDALGRMVEQNRSSVYTEIVYAPNGGKLALMSGTTLQKGYVPLTGGSMAVYNSSGLAYYRHSDWIGSSRFASTTSRTMYFDGAYGPFGEAYAQTGTSDLSFTGVNQDTASNMYDFPARQYGIQGRWPSPDPAGMSSAHIKDPQTWNRYAYARNNPLAITDPTGMYLPCKGMHCVSGYVGGDDACFMCGGDDSESGFQDIVELEPSGGAPNDNSSGDGSNDGTGDSSSSNGSPPCPIVLLSCAAQMNGQAPGNPQPPDIDGDLADLSPADVAAAADAQFGVLMTSFTPSSQGQNGSFSGLLAGVPFTVTNDVNTYDVASIQNVFAPGCSAAIACTSSANPYVNYTANNVFQLYTNVQLNFYQGAQLWELGNSLGFISAAGEGLPAPTIGQEPARPFCSAIPGCMTATNN